MAQENLQQVLANAVQLAKAGNRAEARKGFIAALKMDGRNETAMLGLLTVTTDVRERNAILKQALTLHPDSPRVQEALRRLNLTRDDIIPPAPAVLQPSPARVEPPAVTPTAPQRPPTRPLKRITTTEMPVVRLPEPEPEPMAVEAPLPAELPITPVVAELPIMPVADTPLPEPVLAPALPLAEVIARLSKAPNGDSGVPVPALARLQEAAKGAQSQLEQHQRAMDARAEQALPYARKDKDRAGEADLRYFQAKIAGAVLALSLTVCIVTTLVALNSPEVQRLVFAPTWTVSPTATSTSTPTPGVTPTSSPTSEVTLTPSPTFPPNIPTRNPLQQPVATDVYAPSGVVIEPLIEQAVELLNKGSYDAAAAILIEQKNTTQRSGDFTPFYFLADLYIREGNLAEARRQIETGDDLYQQLSRNESYRPMINVAYARVQLAELQAQAAQRVTVPNRQQVLTEITDKLEEAISFDANYTDAYVLLADRYLLTGDTDAALEVLENALLEPTADLAQNSVLHTKRASILFQLGRYDTALQELYDTLLLNPYAEQALELQVQTALAQGDFGTAVIYAEQYMARYPGSVNAIKLRGDAWLAEGKNDRAMQEYTRALNGDERSPAYAQVLISRASLYTVLGQHTLALEDLNRAFRLTDDPQVQYARALEALQTGNTTLALNDVSSLREGTDIPSQALDRLEAEAYVRADESLETAINLLSNLIAEASDTPTAETYALLAQAYQLDGNVESAYNTINLALQQGDTLPRRLMRAELAAARADVPDLADEERRTRLQRALEDYDWVLSFAPYYRDISIPSLQAAIETLTEKVAAIPESTAGS